MGSIEKRGDRFRARAQGRRGSATFGTREEAESWIAAQEALLLMEQARQSPKTAIDRLLASLPERVVQASASLPVPPEVVVARSMPNPEQAGVYFLIDGGVIKYVGQAVNVLRRVQRHLREGRTFERFWFLPCEAADLDATEERYIVALMPEWNRAWWSRRKKEGDDRQT